MSSPRPEWEEVKQRCEEGIENATRRLQARGCTPSDADIERGLIEAYRDILRLGRPADDIPTATPLY
jgi:hypothetical protein